MVQIFASRFTPGTKGDSIHLEKGEVVTYRLLNGKEVQVTIDSDRMTHERCATYGYEGIFHDTNERGFADGARIVGWEGRAN